MLELSNILVDETLAKDGVWVNVEGANILICATEGNEEFGAFLTEKGVSDNSVSNESEVVAYAAEGLAKYIVKDWKEGDIKENGKVVEYSEKNCKRILEKYPRLAIRIFNVSTDYTNFVKARREKLAKN